MRAGRLLLLIVPCLVLAAVAAVWLVPSLLDWNRYRDDIAALVSRGIARPVRITGDVSLSLLPEPVLTASGMTVADSGDGIALRAESVRLRVSLAALLAGRVDARELVLRGADLRVPWPPQAGALAQRPPAWLSGLQARVERSRLQVGGVVFTDIAAALATDPDTGTLSANGTGRLDGQAWRVIARLSEPGRDGTAALDASVDGEDKLRDTGGTFSGQIGADGALSGRATARGPDLSLLLPAPPLPWTGEGRLTASAGLAVADELQVVLAGVPARGAVALRVGPDARLDVALASNRLDGDAWWPVLLRGAAPSLPTGIDLSAEAATFAGGQLRRVRAGLDLGPDGAVVRDATAELPGQAMLSLSGTAGRDGGFHGAGRLQAPDLAATLRWLEPLVPGLAAVRPDGALRSGQVAAGVAAENGTIVLTDLRGVLDGATVSGSATFRPGTRPFFGGDLQTERLALDPWLPAFATGPDLRRLLPNLARRFAGFDTTLKVSARASTWHGLPVPSASLDLAADHGRVVLRRLAAGLRGVRVAASGTLGDGARLSEGVLDMQADDAAAMAPLLPSSWSVLAPLLTGPASLGVRGAGPPEALALRVTAEVSDLHLEASPVLDVQAGKVAGPLTLHHPGAPRLFRVFGLDRLAETVGDGSFSFLAQVLGEPGGMRFDPVQLSAGSARLGGQVTLRLGNPVAVSGRVSAESLPLPDVSNPADPLPLALLAGLRANLRLDAAELTRNGRTVATGAGAQATLADGKLVLGSGTATIAGAPFSFEATVDSAATPPAFAGSASVTGAALGNMDGVGVGGGTLDGRLRMQATGHSPAALLTTLNGEATLSVRNGMLHGLDLPGASAAVARRDGVDAVLSAVRTALTGGDSPFAQLDAQLSLSGGVATATAATLTDSAGTAAVSGTIYLPTGTVEARIVRPARDATPGYGVTISGTLPELTRTPELAGLARQLAEAPVPATQ